MTSATAIRIGLAAALIAAGLLWRSCRPAAPRKTGSRAADFQLTSTDGTPFRLAGHSGKVILLNFFSGW